MVNVLLAVTGSVAAIKAADVVKAIRSELSDRGHVTIKVVVTERSKHFLPRDGGGEVSASVLDADAVHDDAEEWLWSERGDPVLHIELVKWADVLVVAPLDSLTLAKIVHGQCDNLVSCACVAWHLGEKPMLVCPSMNTWMWTNPATKENIRRARSFGIQIVWPISKRLMCGDVGVGAMERPDNIARRVKIALEGGDGGEYPEDEQVASPVQSPTMLIIGLGAMVLAVVAMVLFQMQNTH